MPDDPKPRKDSSKLAESSLYSLPVFDNSVWTKLLTGAAVIQEAQQLAIASMTAGVAVPKFNLSAITHIQSTVDFPKVYLPEIKFPEIDFERTFRNMEDLIQQLAMRCWSLPWHLSILETQELVNEKPEDIDAFFEAYFEDGGLETLRNDVLDAKTLAKWKVLLEQCFKNYSNGDFQICIPSLIAVLEGSFNYPAFFREGHREKFFKERIHTAKDFQRLTWISLCKFCEVVFMPGDTRRTTVYINRQKVMRGADDPSGWKKVDCLRLFQALDSTRRLK